MTNAAEYWGLREENGLYSHIYTSIGCVKMCCSGADEISNIVELNVVEHFDQTRPAFEEADYWGFKYESESAGHFEMIQSSLILLEVCFTYGLKSAEDKSDGRAYRLLISEKQ